MLENSLRRRQILTYSSFACLIRWMHYCKYFSMSKQSHCLIALYCAFAVHYYKVHFSVPETPLVSLLCCTTMAGILLFGALDTKTPVWLICITNNLITGNFQVTFTDMALKKTLRFWGKSHLMFQWHLIISPIKLRWNTKENAVTWVTFLCFIFIWIFCILPQ